MPPNLQSSEPLDKSNEAQGGAAELDSAQLAELEKIRQLDAMFEKEFQWRPRSLFTILRRIFFFEDKSSWKYPLSERLNTETAERKIDSSPLRRLEVAPGFLDSYEVNSRHNFHVVKDGQSAYVILKTKEFILDAMGRLERRGQRFYYVAVAAFAAAITMMTLGLIYAYHNLTNSVPLAPKVQDAFLMNEVPYQFALRILGVLGASGLLLIVVKMLLAVAKHQCTKLLRTLSGGMP